MTTTTDTPPAPPEPQLEPQAEPAEIGFFIFLPDADPSRVDAGEGGPIDILPPARPPAGPRLGYGRNNDGFWRMVGWAFCMLLAFAVGGIIGELGKRWLEPTRGE